MSISANVLSIQALEDLRAAIKRFSSEAQESLNAAALEIRRTQDWLTERRAYWQREVQRRQEILRRVEAALAACRASGYRDARTGAYYEPPCTAQREAVLQAQVRLRESEAELRNVQEWTRLVQQMAADYQTQARRLAGLLGTDLPKATALLGRKIAALHSYAAMSASLVESAPTGDSLSGVSTAADVDAREPPEPKEPGEPGPVTPPEIREGTAGGPERGG